MTTRQPTLQAPLQAPSSLHAARVARQAALGQHHDLAEIFKEVNKQYFKNNVKVKVRWGRRYHRPPRTHKTTHLGNCFWTAGLIIIHSTLDRSWVPRWFIANILFHEMLHIVLPPSPRSNGKRTIHHVAFCEMERLHPDYERAADWERQNIRHLLRF